MKLVTILTLTVFLSVATAGPEALMEVTQLITSAINQETGTFAEDAQNKLTEAHSLLSEIELSSDQEKLAVQSMNSMVTYNLACLEALNGNTDEAFRWLEESVSSGYGDPEWMIQDSDLDGLKEDARFDELVEAAGENYVEPTEQGCGSCANLGTCN